MANSRVVSIRVADTERVRTFVNGVAAAWARFADLTPADLGTLPAPARDGITALRDTLEEFTGETIPRPGDDDQPPPEPDAA